MLRIVYPKDDRTVVRPYQAPWGIPFTLKSSPSVYMRVAVKGSHYLLNLATMALYHIDDFKDHAVDQVYAGSFLTLLDGE